MMIPINNLFSLFFCFHRASSCLCYNVTVLNMSTDIVLVCTAIFPTRLELIKNSLLFALGSHLIVSYSGYLSHHIPQHLTLRRHFSVCSLNKYLLCSLNLDSSKRAFIFSFSGFHLWGSCVSAYLDGTYNTQPFWRTQWIRADQGF